MNFETLDWELEARRVMAAFEIIWPCYFSGASAELSVPTGGRRLVPVTRQHPNNDNVYLDDGTCIQVYYSAESRAYNCRGNDNVSNAEYEISLGWDGKVEFMINLDFTNSGPQVKVELAKAIFKLGLWTAEVEKQMGVTISAHERVGWELNFEARTKETL